MVVAFDDNHIIYYHMDVQQSTGLVWTYFMNPDYLVVQCLVCVAFLFPDMINQIEPHVYHYTKFLMVKWVTPLGLPCTKLVVVTSFANPALPNVLTAHPAIQSANITVP